MQGLLIREAASTEEPYILCSWRESYVDHRLDKRLPKSIVRTCWGHGVIPRLIERSTILAACHEDHPDVLLGWIAFQIGQYPDRDGTYRDTCVVHYCHVKKSFQGLGIGRELVRSAVGESKRVEYSHETESGSRIRKPDWTPALWRTLL